MIENFIHLAGDYWKTVARNFHGSLPNFFDDISVIPKPLYEATPSYRIQAFVKKINAFPDSELLFTKIFSRSYCPFWLDSAKVY